MKITISMDARVIERVRKILRASGKTLNQEIRDHLRGLVREDDQLQTDLDYFKTHSGLGNSGGWKWNREELYEERIRWPRE